MAATNQNIPKPNETKEQFLARVIKNLMLSGKSQAQANQIATSLWTKYVDMSTRQIPKGMSMARAQTTGATSTATIPTVNLPSNRTSYTSPANIPSPAPIIQTPSMPALKTTSPTIVNNTTHNITNQAPPGPSRGHQVHQYHQPASAPVFNRRDEERRYLDVQKRLKNVGSNSLYSKAWLSYYPYLFFRDRVTSNNFLKNIYEGGAGPNYFRQPIDKAFSKIPGFSDYQANRNKPEFRVPTEKAMAAKKSLAEEHYFRSLPASTRKAIHQAELDEVRRGVKKTTTTSEPGIADSLLWKLRKHNLLQQSKEVKTDMVGDGLDNLRQILGGGSELAGRALPYAFKSLPILTATMGAARRSNELEHFKKDAKSYGGWGKAHRSLLGFSHARSLLTTPFMTAAPFMGGMMKEHGISGLGSLVTKVATMSGYDPTAVSIALLGSAIVPGFASLFTRSMAIKHKSKIVGVRSTAHKRAQELTGVESLDSSLQNVASQLTAYESLDLSLSRAQLTVISDTNAILQHHFDNAQSKDAVNSLGEYKNLTLQGKKPFKGLSGLLGDILGYLPGKLEQASQYIHSKYVPTSQLGNYLFKRRLPHEEMQELQDTYNPKKKQKIIKKYAEDQEKLTGIHRSVMRLLITPSDSIANLGESLSVKQVNLLMGIYDVMRYNTMINKNIAVRAHGIRPGDILPFPQISAGLLDKIPVISAIKNIITDFVFKPLKVISSGISAVTNLGTTFGRIFGKAKHAVGKGFDWLQEKSSKGISKFKTDPGLLHEKALGSRGLTSTEVAYKAMGQIIPNKMSEMIGHQVEHTNILQNIFHILSSTHEYISGSRHVLAYSKHHDEEVMDPFTGEMVKKPEMHGRLRDRHSKMTDYLKKNHSLGGLGAILGLFRGNTHNYDPSSIASNATHSFRPPGFAKGGYHDGGYRVVGEKGTELEYTGSSRVHSSNSLVDIFHEALHQDPVNVVLVRHQKKKSFGEYTDVYDNSNASSYSSPHAQTQTRTVAQELKENEEKKEKEDHTKREVSMVSILKEIAKILKEQKEKKAQGDAGTNKKEEGGFFSSLLKGLLGKGSFLKKLMGPIAGALGGFFAKHPLGMLLRASGIALPFLAGGKAGDTTEGHVARLFSGFGTASHAAQGWNFEKMAPGGMKGASAGHGLINSIETIGDKIGDAKSFVKNGIAKGAEKIGNFGAKIGEGASTVGRNISNIGDIVGDVAGHYGKNALDAVRSSKIGEGVSNAVSKVSEWGSDTKKAIMDSGVVKSVESVGEVVQKKVSNMGSSIFEQIDKATSAAKTGIDWVKDKFKSLGDFVESIASGLQEQLVKAKDGVKSVYKTITEAKSFKLIMKSLKWLADKINWVFQKIDMFKIGNWNVGRYALKGFFIYPILVDFWKLYGELSEEKPDTFVIILRCLSLLGNIALVPSVAAFLGSISFGAIPILLGLAGMAADYWIERIKANKSEVSPEAAKELEETLKKAKEEQKEALAKIPDNPQNTPIQSEPKKEASKPGGPIVTGKVIPEATSSPPPKSESFESPPVDDYQDRYGGGPSPAQGFVQKQPPPKKKASTVITSPNSVLSPLASLEPKFTQINDYLDRISFSVEQISLVKEWEQNRLIIRDRKEEEMSKAAAEKQSESEKGPISGALGAVKGFAEGAFEKVKNFGRGVKDKLFGVSVPDLKDPNNIGALSAKYESKGDSSAIGFDNGGGASYGKYQIATKTGTMSRFLDYLKENNPEAYKQLSAVSGSMGERDGAFAQKWKELAGAGALSNSEHDFIKKTHYDEAFQKISDPKVRDMIASDPVLQQVLWSRSVHLGAGGASSLINSISAGGVTDKKKLVEAIYDQSINKFNAGKLGERTMGSLRNRFSSEKDMALRAMDSSGGGDASQMASAAPIQNGGMAFPVNKEIVTSPMGPRNVPGGSTDHKGNDYRGAPGDPVFATMGGKVTASSSGVVQLKHDNGLTSVYRHMPQPRGLQVGMDVQQGQQIGEVGTVGTKAPHLHFELRNGNRPMDPDQVFKSNLPGYSSNVQYAFGDSERRNAANAQRYPAPNYVDSQAGGPEPVNVNSASNGMTAMVDKLISTLDDFNQSTKDFMMDVKKGKPNGSMGGVSSEDIQKVTTPSSSATSSPLDQDGSTNLAAQQMAGMSNSQTPMITNLGGSESSASNQQIQERMVDPVSRQIIDKIFANTLVAFQQSTTTYALGQSPFSVFK